jgi:uncharacterized damage-inducible protein DinB
MRLNKLLLEAMNREVERSRWALQALPADRYDWKPHDRSMGFGYLANMVATIPSWITAIVTRPDLDIAPLDGPTMTPERMTTSAQFVRALDEATSGARDALASATDDQLHGTWQLKAGGTVVQQAPRYEMILDTFTHWAHHRGQMTVYLRLMGATVPAIYGPSADDTTFR